MNRTACTIVVLTFALTLALAAGGTAQQQQHQEHHPEGASASQDKPTVTAAEEQGQAPMMQPMRGMMGQGGMMMQHLEGLSQHLKLSDEQRAQAQTLLRNHAKDIIPTATLVEHVLLSQRFTDV